MRDSLVLPPQALHWTDEQEKEETLVAIVQLMQLVRRRCHLRIDGQSVAP